MDSSELVLTAPVITPAKSVTGWRVVLFGVERDYDGSTVRISVISQNNIGERVESTYTFPPKPGDVNAVGVSIYDPAKDAKVLLAALNTANLSVKSLHRRLLEKQAADGDIGPGTVN